MKAFQIVLFVLATLVELLASFGIGQKWDVQLIPFGLAIAFLAFTLGYLPARQP